VKESWKINNSVFIKKPIYHFVMLTNSANSDAYASKANLEWKKEKSQKFRIVQKSSNY